MSRMKYAARAAVLLAIAGCTGDATSPTAATDAEPVQTLADAAHSGAVPGFYFLPPMVPSPAPAGTFDAGLQPRVEICQLAGPACGATIATFAFGSGSSSVRVDAGAEHYIANWKTSKSLDPNAFYRIQVFVGAFRLGYADVDVVANGKDRKGVDDTQFVAVKAGQALPIKFRIETGIAAQVVVSPDSASIAPGATQPFSATVTDLHGNAIPGAPVTWASSAPAVATMDGSGLATGVSPGMAVITATSGAARDDAALTVFNPNTPPVAVADTFQAIGNVTVPVAAPGVLGNDTDGEGNPLSAVAGTFPTTAGGTVTLNADGSFRYLSPAGFTGQDGFVYTVTDGVDSATASVAVNSAYRVWYVDNAAAAPGDGRDASPFATLKGAEAASAAGETIFLRYGNGTAAGYDEGIVLKAGQSLTGQGVPASVTATLNGETVVLLAAGSTPQVTRASGTTVQVSTDNVLQGFRVASADGAGIAGTGFGTLAVGSVSVDAQGGPALDLSSGDVTGVFGMLSASGSTTAGLRLVGIGGSVSAAGGTITVASPATAGVEVTGGAGTFTYGGDIVATGPRPVAVTGRTGGALTIGGTIASTGGGIRVADNTGGSIAFTGSAKSLATGTNPGVRLANNAGATISFGGGGLAVATTTGNGFEAMGGGTVTVTGAGNTVTSAGGVAVRVQNTTIGAAGLSFRSVSATGGANGIVLENTGALNGMQVTGDGSTAGSGGTLQNTGTAGILADGARHLSFRWMQLTSAATVDGGGAGTCDAIVSTGCNGAVKLVDARDVELHRLAINGSAEHGVLGRNVTGLVISESTIQSAGNAQNESGIHLSGLFGTANSIVQTVVSGSGHHNVYVTNSTATASAPGTPDRLAVSGSTISSPGTAVPADGIFVSVRSVANFQTVIASSTISGNGTDCVQVDAAGSSRSGVVIGSSTISGCGTAVNLSGSGTSATVFEVSGNPLISSTVGTGVNVASNGSASIRGSVTNNASITPSSPSNNGSGVDVVVDQTGLAVVDVNGNTITGHAIGIRGGARNPGAGTADLTVRNNTVTLGGPFEFAGAYFFSGNGSAGESNRTCVNLSNNDISVSGAFNADYWLEQWAGNTFELHGFAGDGTDEAAVEAFVSATDTGGATVEAFGGGVVDFSGGACEMP